MADDFFDDIPDAPDFSNYIVDAGQDGGEYNRLLDALEREQRSGECATDLPDPLGLFVDGDTPVDDLSDIEHSTDKPAPAHIPPDCNCEPCEDERAAWKRIDEALVPLSLVAAERYGAAFFDFNPAACDLNVFNFPVAGLTLNLRALFALFRAALRGSAARAAGYDSFEQYAEATGWGDNDDVGLAELSSALAIYFSAHITPLFEDVAARLTGEALLAVTAHFKSSPDEMKDSEDYAFLEKILRQPSRYGEAFQKGIASAAGVRFASFVRSPDERATRERKPEKADALSALVMSRLSTADADAKTIKAKLKEEEGIDISESYIYKELKKRFGGTRKLKLRDDD